MSKSKAMVYHTITIFLLPHNLNSLVFNIFFLAYFLSLLVKTSVGIYSRIPILVGGAQQKTNVNKLVILRGVRKRGLLVINKYLHCIY